MAFGTRWAAPLLTGALLVSVSSRATGADLPRCPAGWRLDVVLRSPRLRHPSVVCCAADGRVFVAEDPMDISAPKADLKQGRILCLHPDGRVTTFAEGLHAVFGMQYIDGKLFVLHNPRFSVFADGGDAGRDERILIECTNPNPWALDWNDHVPANFRLAMDGYLYVAVGDKGVYGAVGRDGGRVDLRGGGILRLRPDGTCLEVYCTGIRNILDVALDDEDELFTYDNTDEHDWMSRLTHMVEGGEYGYPHDFVPRRPYTLWMMADYGSGAATGTLCYTEDALPPEYRGNLFLADFLKRQVLRVAVARDGATFRVTSKSELFAEPPGDFRPVGIAAAPDGLGLYICDWQHADTKETVAVGRLLKLSYTGASQGAPKPHWCLDAAAGRPCRAADDELIQGLSHPARSVRDVAQRRLGERGAWVVAALVRLLGDANAPAPAPACPLGARRHRLGDRRSRGDPHGRVRRGPERAPAGPPPARLPARPPGAGGGEGSAWRRRRGRPLPGVRGAGPHRRRVRRPRPDRGPRRGGRVREVRRIHRLESDRAGRLWRWTRDCPRALARQASRPRRGPNGPARDVPRSARAGAGGIRARSPRAARGEGAGARAAGRGPQPPAGVEGGVVGLPPGAHAPTGQDRALGGDADGPRSPRRRDRRPRRERPPRGRGGAARGQGRRRRARAPRPVPRGARSGRPPSPGRGPGGVPRRGLAWADRRGAARPRGGSFAQGRGPRGRAAGGGGGRGRGRLRCAQGRAGKLSPADRGRGRPRGAAVRERGARPGVARRRGR